MSPNTHHDHRHQAAPRASGEGHGGHHHAAEDHAGHDQHAGHSPKMFRDKFWLSLILTVPVVFWATHIQMIFRYEAPEFPASTWISPVLGTAVFLYGGLDFLKGAWSELRARLPGMMTLISLAISVAFIFSWVVQLGFIQTDAIWWELAIRPPGAAPTPSAGRRTRVGLPVRHSRLRSGNGVRLPDAGGVPSPLRAGGDRRGVSCLAALAALVWLNSPDSWPRLHASKGSTSPA